MKQDNLKREIAGLLLQLKDVEEDITAIYLEDKIRNLNAKLKDENSNPAISRLRLSCFNCVKRKLKVLMINTRK
jgi:hypothetical protein